MKEWDKLGLRIALEEFLRSKFPPLWEKIELIQKDKTLLQHRGAEVFFAAYQSALLKENVPAGIPLHDGWIFPARDNAQAVRVKAIFEEKGSEMLGQPMPVKAVILN
jgi:hypothetical protein